MVFRKGLPKGGPFHGTLQQVIMSFRSYHFEQINNGTVKPPPLRS